MRLLLVQGPGIEIKDRGRIPTELMVKFNAATAQCSYSRIRRHARPSRGTWRQHTGERTYSYPADGRWQD